MKKTQKAIQVLISSDQTAVYSSSRLPKPQFVGYLYAFPADSETVSLWNAFGLDEQQALVQQAIDTRKDIRRIVRETAYAN
jgi:hypothetical protein